jgi:hypothetical protein
MQMTLEDVLCVLRQKLIDSRNQNDKESLMSLATTLMTLTDISYGFGNRQLSAVIEAMGFAAIEAYHGVGWKADVPSIEEIKLIFHNKQ